MYNNYEEYMSNVLGYKIVKEPTAFNLLNFQKPQNRPPHLNINTSFNNPLTTNFGTYDHLKF